MRTTNSAAGARRPRLRLTPLGTLAVFTAWSGLTLLACHFVLTAWAALDLIMLDPRR